MPVEVIDFDYNSNNFLIRFLDTNIFKQVKRFLLIFNFENIQTF